MKDQPNKARAYVLSGDVAAEDRKPVVRAGGEAHPRRGEDAGDAEDRKPVVRAGGEAHPPRREDAGDADGERPHSADRGVAEAARVVLRAGPRGRDGGEAVDDGTGGEPLLGEWTNYAARMSLRNTQAIGELMNCRTLFDLLQWQSDLLTATAGDLIATNARVLRSVTPRA